MNLAEWMNGVFQLSAEWADRFNKFIADILMPTHTQAEKHTLKMTMQQ